uniref:CHK kinase-like domain-containing protein n=3 Tax=Lygus hesperus TaxID=30085 RepID=A0A0K8TB43_LYGHE
MDETRSRIVAMTKAGVFGPPGMWPYVRDNNGEHQIGLQFASDLEFYRIGLFRTGSADSEPDYREIYVAVKTQLKGEDERAFTNSDSLFFNEVYMYRTVLQLIEAEKLFLRCFYAEACSGNHPSRDIVITEDMKPLGYRTPATSYLDLQHLKIALRNLGRFHGHSYKAKTTCASYFSKVKDLRPIAFDEEFDALLFATTCRGIKGLIEGKYNSTLKTLQETLQGGRQVLKSLKTPEEPFAVVCHGEFHKSNMLFCYDSCGEVSDAVFLDLQMSLYSDPSTDISFLLYMNTTSELRSRHWDELLERYWDGVVSVMPDPGFDFEQFLSNFERKAMYGYLPTSIFLPILLEDFQADVSIKEFLQQPLSERVELLEEFGGEEATKALTEIVKDLLERGYVQHFLDQFLTSR